MNKQYFVLKLFKKYPDKPWDMSIITKYTYLIRGINGIEKLLDEHEDKMRHMSFAIYGINKIYSELTEEILEKHIDMKWDWLVISINNKNISFEFYEKHFDKDFSHLAVFEKIDDTVSDKRIISFLLNTADRATTHWISTHWICEISKNKRITPEIIQATTPQYKWNWNIILNRPDMIFPVEFFIENYETFRFKTAFVDNYMRSNKVTIEFIEKLIEKYPKILGWAICAKCITLDFVIKHKKKIKNSNYQNLYENDIVTFDYLKKINKLQYVHPKSCDLSLKDCIDYDININKLWFDSKITIDDLIEYCQIHPQFSLNWSIVSRCEYIKMEDIEKNLHLPWEWKFVSQNPNITPKFIKKYSHKLSFNDITRNSFTFIVRAKERCCYLYFLNKVDKICSSIRRYIIDSYF